MTEPTMRDVLDRLEAQEKELAALRTARTRRTRLPGGRKSRILTLGIIALLVALVPLSILAATPFIDLTGGDHDADINSAYNLGLTNGCTPTEYCPTNNVTRQEMASFITRKVIPFSDFFTPSLSIKDVIREMVVKERAKGQPLTDREICSRLLQQGIRIARRTVAKYRAELGILPSTMR